MSFSSYVLDILPTPRYTALCGGGLEISEHSVKHLILEPARTGLGGGKGFTIKASGSDTLPPGSIRDGEVGNAEALGEVLRAVRAKMGTPFVHVSLPEQKGYIFTTSFPRTPELSVKEAVAFTLEEHVPLSTEEAIFDCQEVRGASEHEVSVNVTVFPRKTVEGQYAALREAGFLPLSFEMESQAAARALTLPGDTRTRMIVDFGDTRTSISIVDRGIVRFTTSLEIAGTSLAAALQKAFNVSEEEADRLKNEEGIVAARRGSKVAEALISTVSALRDEINRRFIYWHTHAVESERAGRQIEEVLLIGGNANLRGLPEYLGQVLRTPVKQPDIWLNVCDFRSYIPPIARNESFRYATVTGLALRAFHEQK